MTTTIKLKSKEGASIREDALRIGMADSEAGSAKEEKAKRKEEGRKEEGGEGGTDGRRGGKEGEEGEGGKGRKLAQRTNSQRAEREEERRSRRALFQSVSTSNLNQQVTLVAITIDTNIVI